MSMSTDNRSPGLQAFIIFIAVITILSVSLRFWARTLTSPEAHRKLHLFWWDDWFALASVVILLVQLGLQIALIHNGFGQHIWTLSHEQILLFSKLLYAGTFFFFTEIALTKFSVLFFLSRIFPARNNSRQFNIALWTCYGLNCAWLISTIFATVFLCNPVQKSWNPYLEGTCGTQLNLYLGNAIPSAVIDLCILLLPLPKIWTLRIGIGRKIGLLSIFILGYAVIVVSIGRLVQVAQTGDKLNTDFPWVAMRLFFWISAEPGISIVCACLPAMLPLGHKITRSIPFANISRSIVKRKARVYSSFRRGPYRTTTSTDGVDTLQREDSSAVLNGHSSANDGYEISTLSPITNTYHAHAIRSLPGDFVGIAVPPRSIHVETDVNISSKGAAEY
ncbi:hypothetical protein GQX73_g8935 [Xylaria multiplex]|uniref:Rhodopsin domain-containing protein n=1 Tax=Xylaria multiplex TaxID=323545 RepID=A0A7C8MK63_9PEZI|nr:hypothetical protein GQX73_g8935 [Xylaria multiplex]